MKKKLLALLVAFVAMFTCSLTFAACKDSNATENETNNSATNNENNGETETESGGETNNGENEEDNKNGGETDNEQAEEQAVEMSKNELKKALEDTLEIKNVTITYESDDIRGAVEIDLFDAVVYYSVFDTTDNTIIEEGYTSDNKDYKKTDTLWQIQPQSTILNEAEQTIKNYYILDVIYYFDEIEWSWNSEINVYTFSYYVSFNHLVMGDISFSGGFVKQINTSTLYYGEIYEENYVYDKINSTTVTEPEDLFGCSKDGKIYVSVFYPDGTPVNGLLDGYYDFSPDFPIPAPVQIQVATFWESSVWGSGVSTGGCLVPVDLDENGQATIDIQHVIDIFADIFEDIDNSNYLGWGLLVTHMMYGGFIMGEGGEYGIFAEGTFPQYLFITLMEA